MQNLTLVQLHNEYDKLMDKPFAKETAEDKKRILELSDEIANRYNNMQPQQVADPSRNEALKLLDFPENSFPSKEDIIAHFKSKSDNDMNIVDRFKAKAKLLADLNNSEPENANEPSVNSRNKGSIS